MTGKTVGFSFKEIKELEKSRKARDAQGLFVVEGKKMFLEAPVESLVCVIAEKDFSEANPKLLERLPGGVPVIADVRAERFAGLSDTKTPQGILAVLKKPSIKPEEILRRLSEGGRGVPDSGESLHDREGVLRRLSEGGRGVPDSGEPLYNIEETLRPALKAGKPVRKAPLLLFLEDLQDPGNAGTILRTAEAAGVDAVFCTKNTVDYYHPKTIRSTMGSIFRVPQCVVEDVPDFFGTLRKAGIRSFAAHLRGKRAYDEEDYRGGSIFLIGNEGSGLSETAAAGADALIRIPMAGEVESLNAAMAAGILMFEASRQRRRGQ